jgi:1-acyl-sn-glycerol-3-phosphate acyltransferase
MLFSIVSWTGGVINTMFWGSIALILSLFDASGDLGHLCSRYWSRVNLMISRTEVKIRGLDNVAGDGPKIFMANHQSIYDILVLAGYLPVQFRWLAKKELFRIPFMGWHMSRGGYIKIDRTSTRRAAESIIEAGRKIREGTSVVIFPEGTRSPDGSLQPFKPGGFSIALAAGVPIIPIGIYGSKDIITKGSLRVNRGMIGIAVGKPIPVSSYKRKEKKRLMEKVREAIVCEFARAKRFASSSKQHKGDSRFDNL